MKLIDEHLSNERTFLSCLIDVLFFLCARKTFLNGKQNYIYLINGFFIE